MALPNTISTGIDIPFNTGEQSYLGPFKSSGGNYYTFAHLSDATQDKLTAWKATDPESTWTEQDTTGRPLTSDGGAMEAIWCYQTSDLIHIIFSDEDQAKVYARFSMASDAWVEVSAGDEDIVITTSVDSTDFAVTIVVASDEDIYVGYNGDGETFHGTDRNRVYWDKSTGAGASWAGPTHLRTTSTGQEHTNITAVLGASDRIHYLWLRGTGIQHRSLSSGDSLDSEQDNVQSTDGFPGIGRGDVYTDASNEKIRIPFQVFSGRDVRVFEFNSGADPTINEETGVSDNDAEQDRGLCACIASRNGTEKESWLAYVEDISRDLFVDVNIDGAGWGTDTEVHDAVDHAHVSCNVITNEAGDTVLGMIIQDETVAGAPVQYTEHLIASGATDDVEFAATNPFLSQVPPSADGVVGY